MSRHPESVPKIASHPAYAEMADLECSTAQPPTDKPDPSQGMEGQLLLAEGEVDWLRARVKRDGQRITELEQQVRQLEANVGGGDTAIRQLENAVEDLEAQNAALTAEVAELEADEAESHRIIERFMDGDTELRKRATAAESARDEAVKEVARISGLLDVVRGGLVSIAEESKEVFASNVAACLAQQIAALRPASDQEVGT